MAADPLCLLAVHAHPDDESSKGAGTVARYHDEGVRTVLVCCTGGEAGDILNPAMDRDDVRANIGAVRREELDAWEHGYVVANRAFADAVVSELDDDPDRVEAARVDGEQQGRGEAAGEHVAVGLDEIAEHLVAVESAQIHHLVRRRQRVVVVVLICRRHGRPAFEEETRFLLLSKLVSSRC